MRIIKGGQVKSYVDGAGKYLGQYSDTALPFGAVEVPVAPDDGSQTWDDVGKVWSAAPFVVVPVSEGEIVLEALKTSGALNDAQIATARSAVEARKRAR